MFGSPSIRSQKITKYPVQDLQNAADWTQQRLIKVNVGLNMDNHVGLLLAVLQRYWKVQEPVYMILQNIFRQILRPHNKLYKSTDKIKKTPPVWAVFLSLHHT
jgi:hypothetical protein